MVHTIIYLLINTDRNIKFICNRLRNRHICEDCRISNLFCAKNTFQYKVFILKSSKMKKNIEIFNRKQPMLKTYRHHIIWSHKWNSKFLYSGHQMEWPYKRGSVVNNIYLTKDGIWCNITNSAASFTNFFSFL
jgi:hypothetical protein